MSTPNGTPATTAIVQPIRKHRAVIAIASNS